MKSITFNVSLQTFIYVALYLWNSWKPAKVKEKQQWIGDFPWNEQMNAQIDESWMIVMMILEHPQKAKSMIYTPKEC